MQTGVYLAVHYLWAGEFVAAYDILCRLMQLVDGASVSDLMQITVKTTEALYLFFVGDCISAGKRVDEALEMAEKSGVHVWDNHVMLHGVAAALGAEQLEKAESLVVRFSKNIENISFLDKTYFYTLLSWKAKLEGNIDQTYSYLVHIHDLFEHMVQVATRVVAHGFFAEALFLKGSLDEANSYLQKAYDIGRGMQSKLVHFMCLLLDAQMRLRQGDELRGLELLRQAFQLGRECTITNFYGWHAPTMSYLCCKALEHNIEPAYARKLIATRNLMPDELPLDLDGWDWPIRVHTLGRFSIALQGKETAFSRKPKNKQMELLKLLISQGEPGTTEEKIRDLLWPDSDGDKGRNLLKVTLHRLRELLGSENAIRLREGRLFIDKRVVWIDAWAFEYSFVKTRAKCSAKTTNQLLKVIDLYQGDFLADECESFRYSAALRERLRNMHASILKQLVDDGMAEDQLQTALHCCRKAHEVNPLSEPICQLLMRLEEKAGLRSEALRTYDRCKKMLADELGSAPSSATQVLYKTIRDGKSDLP
jgi:DNA-binding SARP family transcriptional activator